MSSKPLFAKQLSSIGDFKLGATFGNGNHALIRLGEQKLTGEQVVIKEIAKSTPSTNRKLRRELEIMAKLRHPHVVFLHHHAETNDRFFLIMQYARKGDMLDIILKSSHLSSELCKRWFSQLVLGVEYMHNVGVCHCDLKPDNVFIDENNNALIGDFGLSCHYDKTEPRVLARPGTLHYSAPETFARHLHSFGFDAESYFGAMGIEVDPNSHCAIVSGPELDIWSLGVVLYVMQTGKYPYWGVNREHPEDQLPTIEAILCQDQPKWPVWIEPGCVDLLMRIFNKNPRQRITIAEIKQHPWLKVEMDRQIVLAREAELAMMQPAVVEREASPVVASSSTTVAAASITATSPAVAAIVQQGSQAQLQQLRNQLLEAKKRNRSSILPRTDSLSRTPSSASRASSAESRDAEPPTMVEVPRPVNTTFLRRPSRTNLLRLHQYTTCLDLRQALTVATRDHNPSS